MHPLLNIALKAARLAGEVITRSIDRLSSIEISEKQKNDYVTDIDRKAEQVIIDTIRRAYPSHGILAEESGATKGDDYLWIIDPLDGTTNFIHGYPHFAVSIGITYRNQLEHGLIFDPIRQEIFTASRGQGAQLNNRRIRVSSCSLFDKALLATGLPYRKHDFLKTYLQTLASVTEKTDDVRRSGSAALDLAYVAASRLDGYWEFGLSAWDLAAGALMVREAGGFISDCNGGEDFLQRGDIVAATPKIYKQLLPLIKESFYV